MKVRKHCLPSAYRLVASRTSCVGHLSLSLISIVSISVILICVLNSPSCTSPMTADGNSSLAPRVASDSAMLSSDTYGGSPQSDSALATPRTPTSPLRTIESFKSKSNKPAQESDSSCVKCLLKDIILGLFMTALGAFFAVWYEDRGHPRLRLTIGLYSDGPRGPHGRVRFLHIDVQNVPR